jgi:hypothetical protein
MPNYNKVGLVPQVLLSAEERLDMKVTWAVLRIYIIVGHRSYNEPFPTDGWKIIA